MIDETTFAGDEASAINQRLREYRANKKMLDELDKSENAELKEVRNFYAYKRKKITEDNDSLLAELLGFIDS